MQLFANNLSVQLKSTLAKLFTLIDVSDEDRTKILSALGVEKLKLGDFAIATLSTPINALAPTLEIVQIYQVEEDDFLHLRRGRENTLLATWPAGTSVDFRLTEGGISSIKQDAISIILTDGDTALVSSDGELLTT